jgi:hypothetical protein
MQCKLTICRFWHCFVDYGYRKLTFQRELGRCCRQMANGHSQRTIAEKLGKSKTAVHNCIVRYQLSPKPEQRKKIVFSDEKKFNLDGPDGWASYYHDVRKPELLHNKRHTGGGGVMIWAAIGWRGKSDVAFIQGNMNSEAYQAALRNHLLPHGARIGGARWIFMETTRLFTCPTPSGPACRTTM